MEQQIRTPQQQPQNVGSGGDVAIPIPPSAAGVPGLSQEQFDALLKALLQSPSMAPSGKPAEQPAQDPTMAEILAELKKMNQQDPSVANEVAYNNELSSWLAKAQLKAARQRAERPGPLMAIATESDQMTVHVDMWRVVKYVGAAVLVAAAGYGLFLLVKVGVNWVARRLEAPAAAAE
jgi:hypothetical protein